MADDKSKTGKDAPKDSKTEDTKKSGTAPAASAQDAKGASNANATANANANANAKTGANASPNTAASTATDTKKSGTTAATPTGGKPGAAASDAAKAGEKSAGGSTGGSPSSSRTSAGGSGGSGGSGGATPAASGDGRGHHVGWSTTALRLANGSITPAADAVLGLVELAFCRGGDLFDHLGRGVAQVVALRERRVDPLHQLIDVRELLHRGGVRSLRDTV